MSLLPLLCAVCRVLCRPVLSLHRCYLYLDEAHSIGCMGAHGKGLCEHAGVDPKDVDVLMGECVWGGGGEQGALGEWHETRTNTAAKALLGICSAV